MNSETIFSIYKYLTSSELEGDEASSSYYLIRIFDDNGNIESDVLSEVYNELTEESEQVNEHNLFGPFQNLTMLNKFSFMLCERLNSSKICLLSVAEFNSALEEISNISELHGKMLEIGNVISNIDKEEDEKGSLIKKWFVGV